MRYLISVESKKKAFSNKAWKPESFSKILSIDQRQFDMPCTILPLGGNLVEHRFDICQFYAAKLLHSAFVAFLGTSLTHFAEILEIIQSITVTSWIIWTKMFSSWFLSQIQNGDKKESAA